MKIILIFQRFFLVVNLVQVQIKVFKLIFAKNYTKTLSKKHYAKHVKKDLNAD